MNEAACLCMYLTDSFKKQVLGTMAETGLDYDNMNVNNDKLAWDQVKAKKKKKVNFDYEFLNESGRREWIRRTESGSGWTR